MIDTVVKAVGDYRNNKVLTLQTIPSHLKPYVNQYYEKSDRHFERLMDICINIPENFTTEIVDNTINIKHDKVTYTLKFGSELTDNDFEESEFVLKLFNKTRRCV